MMDEFATHVHKEHYLNQTKFRDATLTRPGIKIT